MFQEYCSCCSGSKRGWRLDLIANIASACQQDVWYIIRDSNLRLQMKIVD
jgi:hypothetical protein